MEKGNNSIDHYIFKYITILIHYTPEGQKKYINQISITVGSLIVKVIS